MIKSLIYSALIFLGVSSTAHSKDFLRLGVTTTFEDSGLAAVLLPKFTADTGIKTQLIVSGTGRTLQLGKNGDVDAVLVHSKTAEIDYLSAGYAIERRDVMYNNFVMVGPNSDPADLRNAASLTQAMSRLIETKPIFVSRGDDSGTYRRELELWKRAGIDINEERGTWYRATGAGMGATLNIAATLDAYTLTDKGTWLKFANQQNLTVLFESDQHLKNEYGLLLINPKRHPHVNFSDAKKFRDWITSEAGRSVIANYKIDGERAFNPSAPRLAEPQSQ